MAKAASTQAKCQVRRIIFSVLIGFPCGSLLSFYISYLLRAFPVHYMHNDIIFSSPLFYCSRTRSHLVPHLQYIAPRCCSHLSHAVPVVHSGSATRSHHDHQRVPWMATRCALWHPRCVRLGRARGIRELPVYIYSLCLYFIRENSLRFAGPGCAFGIDQLYCISANICRIFPNEWLSPLIG